MSVASKLFVTVGKSQMFDVLRVVTETLNVYSREKLDTYIKSSDTLTNRLQYKKEDHTKKFTNGCSFFVVTEETISFTFGSGDKNLRSLSVIFGCDSDYNDIHTGEKVILSVDQWGLCEEFMPIVGEALKELGKVYYDFDDCDEHDFVLL